MADEADRTVGLLTSSQRDALAGNYDGKPDSEERLRRRIPDRIRHSILDFALLADGLPEDDREEIFSPAEYPLGESDGHLYGKNEHFTEFVRNYPDDAVGTPGEGYIHQRSGVDTETLEHLDVIEGLHTALGFIYRATDDAEIPFDSFLETAIRRALDMDPRRYEVRVETAVKLLPPDPKPDVDTAMEKMQRDQSLTDAEFRVLIRDGPFDPEQVIDYDERQQGDESETVEFTEGDVDMTGEVPEPFEGLREWREERAEAFRERREGEGDGEDAPDAGAE